jgi:hypothetical protein
MDVLGIVIFFFLAIFFISYYYLEKSQRKALKEFRAKKVEIPTASPPIKVELPIADYQRDSVEILRQIRTTLIIIQVLLGGLYIAFMFSLVKILGALSDLLVYG